MTTTIPGLDLTALWGGYASSIMQAIAEQVPTTEFGGVAFGNTPPDTFTNPVLKRYIWVKPNVSGIYTIYYFDDDVVHDWVDFFSLAIPANSIKNSQIIDNTIELGKLSVSGGVAGQVPVVNAGVTDFEFKNPADTLPADSLAVTKLTKPGTTDRMLTNIGGVNDWTLLSAILSYIADGSIGLAKLTRGAASTRGLFLMTDSTGSTVQWTAFMPSIHIGNGTISLDKLAPGTEGYQIKTVSGVPAWAAGTAATECAKIRYAPASGTAPQSVPHNVDTTVNIDGSATIAASWLSVGTNEFTLAAGTYGIQISVRFLNYDTCKVWLALRNKTDASVVTGIETTYNLTSGDDAFELFVSGSFTIAAGKTFDLRINQFSGRTSAEDLGQAASIATKNENYVNITIQKYA